MSMSEGWQLAGIWLDHGTVRPNYTTVRLHSATNYAAVDPDCLTHRDAHDHDDEPATSGTPRASC